MADQKSPEGIDIEALPIGELLRHLSVGSWVWLLGLLGGVFLLGYQTPIFLNKVQPSELLAAEREKSRTLEQTVQNLEGELATIVEQLSAQESSSKAQLKDAETALADLTTELETTAVRYDQETAQKTAMIDSLGADLQQKTDELEICLSEQSSLTGEIDAIRSQLTTCANKLDNVTVDLWYVHQGDGRGYPEGNNSDVHNHDNRPNWNSRRFRNEACLQRGGPRIDDAYASRICGNKQAVGPLGVLDVGGGTCGHGVYLIGCVN
ncbi:MAG: hypothetical protein AAF999_09025 [Pseudomonadota bacterium]